MTISQTLKLAITKLIASRITDVPRLEAEILLSHALKKPREFIFTHPEYQLAPKQISNFKSLISKRLEGEPIAYIIGHKEFYGLDFKINKNVLIPRPETELMVEEALKLIALQEAKLPTGSLASKLIIDVGTGSGCVIIALAKLMDDKSQIRDQKLIGIDISLNALAIAKQNAKLNEVKKNVKFLRGDLLKPLIKILDSRRSLPAEVAGGNDNLKKKFVIGNLSLVILANLPYLTPSQIKNSPSIKREPKSALNGGSDGLKYYCQLFKQIRDFITPLRVMCYVLCEFDSRQTAKIKQLIKHELPGAKLQIKKDLSGLNRLAIAQII